MADNNISPAEPEVFEIRKNRSIGFLNTITQAAYELSLNIRLIGQRIRLMRGKISTEEYNKIVDSMKEKAQEAYDRKAQEYDEARNRPKAPLFARNVTYNNGPEQGNANNRKDRESDEPERGVPFDPKTGSPVKDTELPAGATGAINGPQPEPEEENPIHTFTISEYIGRGVDTDDIIRSNKTLTNILTEHVGRPTCASLAELTAPDGSRIDALKITVQGFPDMYYDKMMNPITKNGEISMIDPYSSDISVKDKLHLSMPQMIDRALLSAGSTNPRAFLGNERATVAKMINKAVFSEKDTRLDLTLKGQHVSVTKENGRIIICNGQKELFNKSVEEMKEFKDDRKQAAGKLTRAMEKYTTKLEFIGNQARHEQLGVTVWAEQKPTYEEVHGAQTPETEAKAPMAEPDVSDDHDDKAKEFESRLNAVCSDHDLKVTVSVDRDNNAIRVNDGDKTFLCRHNGEVTDLEQNSLSREDTERAMVVRAFLMRELTENPYIEGFESCAPSYDAMLPATENIYEILAGMANNAGAAVMLEDGMTILDVERIDHEDDEPTLHLTMTTCSERDEDGQPTEDAVVIAHEIEIPYSKSPSENVDNIESQIKEHYVLMTDELILIEVSDPEQAKEAAEKAREEREYEDREEEEDEGIVHKLGPSD